MANNKQTAAPDAAQSSDNPQQLLVEQLTQQLAVATTRISTLENELSTEKENSRIIAESNHTLSSELSDKTVDLENAEALIEEMQGKLAAAEVSQMEGPVILSHEKGQYRVLAPKFSHKGIEVEANSLRNNPELVRELVEAGSGLLQKVEAKG